MEQNTTNNYNVLKDLLLDLESSDKNFMKLSDSEQIDAIRNTCNADKETLTALKGIFLSINNLRWLDLDLYYKLAKEYHLCRIIERAITGILIEEATYNNRK